jgi:hypothetical protein
MLAPGAGRDDVTADDMAAAAEKNAETGKNAAKQQIVDVICPHCQETFGLDRKAIV